MPSALPRPAPSYNLVRLLRSQAQAVFSSHHGCADSARPVAISLPPCRLHQRHSTLKRRFASSAVSRAGNSRKPLGPKFYTSNATSSSSTCVASSKPQDSLKSWQERLWGSSAIKGGKPLKPSDLPGRDDAQSSTLSMFNSRRIQTAKAASEPRLRCTEVDEGGKVILVDGEFKKTELIAKFGLLPRDLRKIDSSNLPHILIRPSAILLNLLHLKVLIKHDRVLLFDVYGSKTSYPQSAFMYDLQGRLQQKPSAGSSGLPYEFRALEAVLTSVTSELEADFEAVREPVMRILSELEDDIDRDKLRILLILSKRVSTFEQKVKLVRDAIEELLEADDDLAAMYLTEKAHSLSRGLDDHTEVEMLLESYHKLTDEIVQEAGNLVSGIRNTEEIVRAILDANRNALMLLDLKFSVGTLGLAMGTFLAGLYGMNLENFIENTQWGFGAITTVSALFSLLVCWYGLVKLRKVQRIKMMRDERPHMSRGMSFREDGAFGLLDSRNRELLRRAHMQKALAAKKRWPRIW
ncbi:hypothetical protein CDD82_231 [Ophiocordyceps australis]|uniref:Magnesium transporter n=1 Tax=Ophiocordyceps australis TaxID=1399860 RepID=A0A2C5YH68_9HYPO|nr:hypothetical protein CDD82_231 [Ophiocordyceps australis]